MLISAKYSALLAVRNLCGLGPRVRTKNQDQESRSTVKDQDQRSIFGIKLWEVSFPDWQRHPPSQPASIFANTQGPGSGPRIRTKDQGPGSRIRIKDQYLVTSRKGVSTSDWQRHPIPHKLHLVLQTVIIVIYSSTVSSKIYIKLSHVKSCAFDDGGAGWGAGTGGGGRGRETVLRQIGLLLLRHHCYTTACAYCFTINMTVLYRANIFYRSNDSVYCIVFEVRFWYYFSDEGGHDQ